MTEKEFRYLLRLFNGSIVLMFMIQGDRSAVEYRRNITHNKIEPQRGSI